jgi:hypothetical protein
LHNPQFMALSDLPQLDRLDPSAVDPFIQDGFLSSLQDMLSRGWSETSGISQVDFDILGRLYLPMNRRSLIQPTMEELEVELPLTLIADQQQPAGRKGPEPPATLSSLMQRIQRGARILSLKQVHNPPLVTRCSF